MNSVNTSTPKNLLIKNLEHKPMKKRRKILTKLVLTHEYIFPKGLNEDCKSKLENG